MKVAFNSSPLSTGHQHRGIGTYTKNLLDALKARSDIKIQEFSDSREVVDADVVHYPFFDLFQQTLPLKKKFPTIVTIHDVTPLIFSQHYPSGKKGYLNNIIQRVALKGVKAIITDSESSKNDISRYLKINHKKIFPIHLAPSNSFKIIKDSEILKKTQEKYQLPESFVLYVGDVNWNKNLINMASACIQIGMDIVFVGKNFEQKENLEHPELKSFKQFLEQFEGNPLVHLLGFVSAEDLVAIMNLAKALLLPSFYEGFGLPILEAQISGLPVITSKISSMPEVAGEGALLVDPYNVEDIARAIKQITDNTTRNKLIKKGFDNVGNFSWSKTADETIDVYCQVVGGNH